MGSGAERQSRLPAAAVAAAAALVLALTASACGTSHDGHSAVTAKAGTGMPGNAADAAFVTSMIPHHEGALEMAKLAQQKSEHPEVKQLAANILKSQQAEIDTMNAMKAKLPQASGHDGHMDMSDHEMGMDGDMGTLAKAKPFDKAFLEMMIPHHQGAVRMAKTQLADGSNAQVKALSRSIITAQNAEIAQMRAWLKAWYGGGAAVSTDSMGGASPMKDGAPVDAGASGGAAPMGNG